MISSWQCSSSWNLLDRARSIARQCCGSPDINDVISADGRAGQFPALHPSEDIPAPPHLQAAIAIFAPCSGVLPIPAPAAKRWRNVYTEFHSIFLRIDRGQPSSAFLHSVAAKKKTRGIHMNPRRLPWGGLTKEPLGVRLYSRFGLTRLCCLLAMRSSPAAVCVRISRVRYFGGFFSASWRIDTDFFHWLPVV